MTGRGPGWPTVLGLALVVMATSVVDPLQLMLIPLAVVLVALPPRSPRLLAFAALLGALAFFGPRGPLWYVERGWALLLAGWFIVAVLAGPGASFVERAVAATIATAATAAVVLAVSGGWTTLDGTVASHFREAAEQFARAFPDGVPGGGEVVGLAAEVPALLFPGLLAVGSVAALGVAWWGYRRLARAGRPLGRLVDFRFPDALVWLLIAGLALLVLPTADWAERIGSNLVLFMAALYALRGLAILVALVLMMVGPQVPILLLVGAAALFLYPLVVVGTLLLGVTDTWLDLRSGRRTANDEG